MDALQEIKELKQRIRYLEKMVLDLTEALKVVTSTSEKAKEFIERVDSIAEKLRDDQSEN